MAEQFYLNLVPENFLCYSIPELPNKVQPFLLIGHYLLPESLPGARTIFIVGTHYLMNGLVYALSIAGSKLNPSLIKDTL